jgi:histone-binding protein RBBP4
MNILLGTQVGSMDGNDAGDNDDVDKIVDSTIAPSPDEPNLIKIARVVLPSQHITIESRKFDEERNELGGYSATKAKVETSIQMVNQGHVDRARFMPQPQRISKDGSQDGYFIVATRMDHGEIGIFDYSKHSSKPRDQECHPQIRGTGGHDEQGYGLSWSYQHKGKLASCSSNKVAIWDISSSSSSEKMTPISILNHDNVSDVNFAWTKRETLSSVNLNGSLQVWDLRNQSEPSLEFDSIDGAELNAVGFQPETDSLIACAGSDSIVYIFDIRNSAEPLYSLKGHTGEIYQLTWNSMNPSLLASCGTDKKVMIWNLKQSSTTATPPNDQMMELDNKEKELSPELVFIHAGHTDTVSDISWKGNLIASVAQDNVIQIWEPNLG